MRINRETILDLYENFLGRFKFFRQFVRLFVLMMEDVETHDASIMEVYQKLDDISNLLIELTSKVQELGEEVIRLKEESEDKTVNRKNKSDFNPRTSHSIIEDFQDAYNSKSENNK